MAFELEGKIKSEQGKIKEIQFINMELREKIHTFEMYKERDSREI